MSWMSVHHYGEQTRSGVEEEAGALNRDSNYCEAPSNLPPSIRAQCCRERLLWNAPQRWIALYAYRAGPEVSLLRYLSFSCSLYRLSLTYLSSYSFTPRAIMSPSVLTNRNFKNRRKTQKGSGLQKSGFLSDRGRCRLVVKES